MRSSKFKIQKSKVFSPESGQSLFEIVLAVGIVTLILVAMALLASTAIRSLYYHEY